ncbi:MAG: ArsR/SmtB family transcription factor [Planctomycetota bacterium]|jgi:DNA-binding transcriptional ArsR family regulator
MPDATRVKAKLFRGLADPSRLAILETLRSGPKNVSQVVELTGLSQPNTSMHLNCLWCCGLVDKHVRGRFSYYRIKSNKFVRILESAENVLEDVYNRIAECERYAEPPR